MYKIYTDKGENFECEVSVKNASLKDSKARLVVESADGINLMFNGKIENGKCTVPIRRLKGLLDENATGKMFLEVIVEDTYFSPWQENFVVEEHTSVKVNVNEQKLPSKPSVTVKVPVQSMPKPQKENLIPLYEISRLCEKFGIKKSNLNQKKDELRGLIKEYFNANPEYSKQKSSVLKGLSYFLK